MDGNKNDNNKQYTEIRVEPLDAVSSTKKSLYNYYSNEDMRSNAQDVKEADAEEEDNERKPNPLDLIPTNRGSKNSLQKNLRNVESISSEDNTAVTNPADMSYSCDALDPSNSNFEPNVQQNSTDRREFTQKRKKSAPQKLVVKKPRENVVYEDIVVCETEELCIILIDVAKNVNITDYVKECGVLENRVQLTNEEGNVKLVFQSVQDYQKVQKKLREDSIKGKKLNFKISGQEADMINTLACSSELINQGTWSPDAENNETKYKDPLGLYGLRIEFLRSLDITPPIDRWVHVTNFRCDKFELRDIMELAGRVLFCSVMHVNKRFAIVQYSHPLEAVQAVSMLNGQMYFGMKLKLYMEPNPRNDIILPKGLANIGHGLGLYGRPIRDIAKQYKNFTRQQSSTISPILFRSDFDNTNSKDEEKEIETESIITSNHHKRSFEVKHAEDLDSIEGVQSEKCFTKGSYSPESTSIKSKDSPASSQDVKDFERPNDFSRSHCLSTSGSLAQSEVPEKLTNPENVLRPDQNPRPQTSVSTSLKPGPFDPQVHNQYQSQRSTLVNQMQLKPNPIFQTMPNPIGNPPQSGPYGMSQTHSSMPQIATESAPFRHNSSNSQVAGHSLVMGQVQTSIPVHGPGPVRGPGPVYGPGPIRGSGPIQGPGSVRGPGPVHGPGPIQGPGPVRGAGLVHGLGPVQGPGLVRGPGPVQGLGLIPGSAPVQGLGLNHGPAPVQGPGLNYGLRPIQGPIHHPRPGQGPGSVSGPGPAPVSGPVSGSGPKGPQGNKVTVEFANLPPSTTFPFLCDKLSQCGQMTSLRFTTPGCAVASFSHPSHAERCYQNYNGMLVEGYRISVTII